MGYFTISPTNANFRGSSDLYNTTTEYLLYATSSGVTLSQSKNSYSYWYVVMTNASFYIINKYYNTNCISATTSGGFSNGTTDNVYSKWTMQFVGLDVPLIQQLPDYCGPCSVLQAITYNGTENQICNNPNNYQTQLATNMNTTSNGTIVGKVKEELNKTIYNFPSAFNSYRDNVINSTAKLGEYCRHSLNLLCPVIVQVKPSILDYYSNSYSSGGHYICLIGVDENNAIVRDCNNSNSYFGEFVIPLNSVHNASTNYFSPDHPTYSNYIICALKSS